MKKLIFLIIWSFAFSACGPDYIYNEEQVILQDAWKYDNIKSFTVDIENIDIKYDLHLLISHGKNYSYENVYMKIHTEFPTIEKKSEQITIQLADKKGQWVGKCSGESCTAKVYLLESFKFPEVGKYTFSFEQFTRDASLNDIEKLTVQIFPSELVE